MFYTPSSGSRILGHNSCILKFLLLLFKEQLEIVFLDSSLFFTDFPDNKIGIDDVMTALVISTAIAQPLRGKFHMALRKDHILGAHVRGRRMNKKLFDLEGWRRLISSNAY